MSKELEQVATRFEELIPELEKAIDHFKIASKHFRSKEVPRGVAHTFAAQGYLNVVSDCISDFSKSFRLKANIDEAAPNG